MAEFYAFRRHDETQAHTFVRNLHFLLYGRSSRRSGALQPARDLAQISTIAELKMCIRPTQNPSQAQDDTLY